MDDFFDKLAALRRDGESFAVATVVARQAPVSAHLGDRAIVYPDGRMDGFVGGACARDIVRKQALESLRTGQPRLVSIRPDATETGASDPEHVIVPMSCASEGAVDVYVEPFVRPRRLVVVGATPVAEALARTAVSLNYDVVRVVDAREQRDLEPQAAALGIRVSPLETLDTALQTTDVAAVVASQGHYDEEALAVILKADVSYVGLVASRKRGATVRALLAETGVAGVERICNPAGLDLGARTPPEVAISILAEIVKLRPSQSATRTGGEQMADTAQAIEAAVPAAEEAGVASPEIAVDPVCGMEVYIANARHTAEVGGTVYYFCCAQCRMQFVREPDPFLSARP